MKVCMLYHFAMSYLERDSRVLKEAKSLAIAGHNVTIILDDGNVGHSSVNAFGMKIQCIGTKNVGNSHNKKVSTLNFLGNLFSSNVSYHILKYLVIFFQGISLKAYLSHSIRILPIALKEKADVYHVHDFQPLLAGWICRIAIGSALIYDSHEYLRESTYVSPLNTHSKKLVISLEKCIAKKCDMIITVTDPLSRLMARNLNIHPPYVIRNLTIQPKEIHTFDLRKHLGLNSDSIIIIYQGGFYKDRGLETLIEVALLMPDIQFVLMGYGDLKQQIENKIKSSSISNMRVIDAVAPDKVIDIAAAATIGIHPMRNTSLNHYYSLGNKISEYVMAGIPIAVSDFPEMRKLAVDEDFGVVFNPENPEDIVRAIKTLLVPSTYAQKKQKILMARDKYCWENEEKKLLAIYDKLKGAETN